MNRIAAMVVSAWVVLAFMTAGVGMVAGTTSSQGAGPDTLTTESGVFADENDTIENETNVSNNDTIENETNVSNNETTTENGGNATQPDNETADGEGLQPGAQLSGVIGVHQAELQGEVQSRTFGLSMAAARSNGSKARLIGNETEQVRDRLQQLENETEALNRSYRNGNISEGSYHAQLAHLTAQIRMTERLINQTTDSAEALPNETLRAHGVNVTMLHQLRDHARNMTGPEVSAIARQIGGPSVGHPMGKERGPPGGMPGQGPPGDTPMNETNGTMPGQGPPNGSTGGGPHNGSNGGGPPGSMGPSNNTTAGNGPHGAGNGSNPGGAGNQDDAGNASDSDRGNGSNQGGSGNQGNPGNASDSDRGNGSGGPPSAVDDAIGTVATLLRSVFGHGF